MVEILCKIIENNIVSFIQVLDSTCCVVLEQTYGNSERIQFEDRSTSSDNIDKSNGRQLGFYK